MDEEIVITALGSEGEGIGTLDGLKVFIEGALPGEKVSVAIQEKKKNYALGSLKFLHNSSPHRVTAPCPLFGQCGGCSIMHLRYEEQLRVKRARVQETLKRIGHLDVPVSPCIPSPSPLFYRNKIQMPLMWDGTKKTAGFYRKGSHDLIPVEKCLIQQVEGEKILQEILPHLQEVAVRYVLIRTAFHSQEALVILVTDGKNPIKPFPVPSSVKGVIENSHPASRNAILGRTWKTLQGRPYIYETLLGKKFKLSAGAFFQVNTAQAEQLYTAALQAAELTKDKTVIDAYCGVGTLALFASDLAKSVVGIEEYAEAIEDAKENATLNGISNCTFFAGKTEHLLQKMPTPDVLFLNPPRKGCDRAVLEHAAAKKIDTLIYVSCDPATLARDLAILVSLGYKITTVIPFDMFPQTMHVETLVALKNAT